MSESTEITVVNRYWLGQGREAFVAAVTALARRVEVEGHPGVRSYRFFAPEGGSEGRAVVTYADPEAWVGHHEIAYDWPEMAALRAVAELQEIAVHGPISAAMRQWMDRAGISARVRDFGPAQAGFTRIPR